MMIGVTMASDGVTVAEGPSVGRRGSFRPGGVEPSRTGFICGRVTANPLKHLASLLCEKLRAAGGAPCNLMQVATEIHSQAENKHNTTMRRIYDVVNVCEGAGLLARTGHRCSELKKKSAADQNVIPKYFPIRRTGKRTYRGRAEIQWLGGPLQSTFGENDRTRQTPCQSQKLELEIEKGQTLDRILQKRRLRDTLSMQVAILQNLLEQNQDQCRLYPDVSENLSSADTVFPMPRSMEPGSSSSEVDSMSSETHLSMSTQDRNVCADLNSPQSSEEYCNVDDFICDYFVDEQRPCAAKRLHLPFVMLATTPETNVDISMTSGPSCQVHLELDRNYCLLDHIQVIKMLPERRVNNRES
ncbi:hypothetical protein KC19_3G174000 [Ceratodon purpureus]|uniref:E2F/DP family winged-helix DNA-binding domain-containing protein n=1 Tax=Ceratodon purpureus TaxID=3225 RepID=A0A8T0IM94_CERPU|nr:hypothetical protein KC19_3G174000 [Ceratodon purpureus]